MKNLMNLIKGFPLYYLIIIIISILTGICAKLFKVHEPINWFFWTFISLSILVILFVWIRQIYWFFTKSGDYEKK